MGCFDLNSFVELNQRARKVSDELLDEVGGESGSQLLLFMVKVMVWYFVMDNHKVMCALMLVMLLLIFWNWHNRYLQSVAVEFSLESHECDEIHESVH